MRRTRLSEALGSMRVERGPRVLMSANTYVGAGGDAIWLFMWAMAGRK